MIDHSYPLQAHFALETRAPFRLILYWKRLQEKATTFQVVKIWLELEKFRNRPPHGESIALIVDL